MYGHLLRLSFAHISPPPLLLLPLSLLCIAHVSPCSPSNLHCFFPPLNTSSALSSSYCPCASHYSPGKPPTIAPSPPCFGAATAKSSHPHTHPHARYLVHADHYFFSPFFSPTLHMNGAACFLPIHFLLLVGVFKYN